MQQLILKLNEIGAVKFGSFTLKSGQISPIYIDLRLIVSYPDLLKEVAESIWVKIKDLPYDLICGVPYTALPIATALSLGYGKSMVMRRKEAKGHGTRKMIEGVFSPGQECLVVEDLITTGASILETIEPLKQEGLKVSHAAVLIDRQQGGAKHLATKGYTLHSVFTIGDILSNLEKANKLDKNTVSEVKEFLSKNQI